MRCTAPSVVRSNRLLWTSLACVLSGLQKISDRSCHHLAGEPPLNIVKTSSRFKGELVEEMVGKIDGFAFLNVCVSIHVRQHMSQFRMTYAAHALIDQFGSHDRLARNLDLRHTATEWVAVGLFAHHPCSMLEYTSLDRRRGL